MAIGVQLLPRERSKKNYQDKLQQRFKFAPEIRRIARHRQLPKGIKKAHQIDHEIKVCLACGVWRVVVVVAQLFVQMSRKNKLERRIKHSKPGAVARVSVRKQRIVKLHE